MKSTQTSPASSFRFNPGEYRLKQASANWEKKACSALRRSVFCQEQGLFERDDADAVDAQAMMIAALTCVIGQPEQVVGTVRVHETEAGIWFGSRLAVQTEFRSHTALGHKLIYFAVGCARAQGCEKFYAQVQLKNRRLFEHLHWRSLKTVDVCGQPHVLMTADFSFYPAITNAEVSFYSPPASSLPRSSTEISILDAAPSFINQPIRQVA